MTTPAPRESPYDALVQSAREALRKGELHRAERSVREALATDPEHAPAYNLLAVIRERQGHRREAMNLLRAALAVEPTYLPAWENLTHLGTTSVSPTLLLGDEAA